MQMLSLNNYKKYSVEDISRIIEMAWDDKIPFEAIKSQFGLLEKETISIMKKYMKKSSYRMWRKRVSGRASKHLMRKSNIILNND